MTTPRTVRLHARLQGQPVRDAVRQGNAGADRLREAADGEPADLCVVNTCTVTAEGDAKSRQTVRRLHQRNPHAAIVVMGCYATRDPEAVGRLPGVVRVITDKEPPGRGTAPLRRHRAAGRHLALRRSSAGLRQGAGRLPAQLHFLHHPLRSGPWCAAGRPRRSPTKWRGWSAAGYPEIVLTGIHLGHYGIDLSRGRPKAEWSRLWHLLERARPTAGRLPRPPEQPGSGRGARRSDPARMAVSRASARICTCACRAAPIAFWPRMKRRYRARRLPRTLPPHPRGARSAGVHDRRHRRLSRRDRRRLRGDLRVVREAGFCKFMSFPTARGPGRRPRS